MKRGQERERARVLKRIHDEISPQLLSAVFLAEILKEKLEGKERQLSTKAWTSRRDDRKCFYIHELKDLFSAEHQLVKALPKMAKAAANKLAAGFKSILTPP